ncbi:cytidylyltransferase domain-containing protein [Pseudodesulfovibrio tunisiensis]|uniref:acylneuraminate cytidylyltransferase family protein n=1 Tax=Pseudodesulfovibrio tunisiensis TaxID=463192 RepID=UPI001FB3C879|nr:acylneuraminate cytidylyltransferase family protein [Pseudodesulfovibrio tunisiensis]
MKRLCIIPARGGSKGIPHKNIADVCGRPLIDYTISQALNSNVFDRIVVSTDDPIIADVACASGAEVPFLRPSEFADDTASPHLGVEYTVDRLKTGEKYEAEGLVVLFPTHPFRTASMLRHLSNRMESHHVVKTVIPVRPDAVSYLCEKEDGRLHPLLQGDDETLSLTAFHVPAGTFYGVTTAYWDRKLHWDSNMQHSFRYHHHELTNPIECIDIDAPEDLEVAREIISRNLYDFTA